MKRLSSSYALRMPPATRCRRVGGILSIFATIFSFLAGSMPLGSAQSAQFQRQISVQFLNFKSGKPMEKLSVTLTFWNGDVAAHGRIDPKNVVREISVRTDKNGKVTVAVPEPVPSRLSIFQPDLTDSFSPDFSPTEVLASGTVTTYRHDESTSKLQISAKPGEIVILDKRLSAVDGMRREIP